MRSIRGEAHMTDLDAIISTLEPLVLERRLERLCAVLAARTRHAAFVFEGVSDTRNASAALRTLDALGFQEAHLVRPLLEGHHDLTRMNRLISRGVDRWLTVRPWTDTTQAMAHLKSRGYRILASHLREDGVALGAIDFAQPVALVFGNEHHGVSDELLSMADGTFRIPMRGMVESYNLSVAAALTAHRARVEIERLALAHIPELPEGTLDGTPYALPEATRQMIYARWLLQTVKTPGPVLKRAGLPFPVVLPEE